MKNGKAEPIKNAILYEPVISRTKPNGNGPIALPNTPIESARPCISPKYLMPCWQFFLSHFTRTAAVIFIIIVTTTAIISN